MKISSAHVASLAVGSARQQMLRVAIRTSFLGLEKPFRARWTGLSDSNFLKDFRVLLDYRHNVLRLSHSSAALRDEK